MKCRNALNVNIGSTISKFADDTEIGGVMDSEAGCLRLHQDIG